MSRVGQSVQQFVIRRAAQLLCDAEPSVQNRRDRSDLSIFRKRPIRPVAVAPRSSSPTGWPRPVSRPIPSRRDRTVMRSCSSSALSIAVPPSWLASDCGCRECQASCQQPAYHAMISRVDPHPQSFQANRTTAVGSRLQETTYVRCPKSTPMRRSPSSSG